MRLVPREQQSFWGLGKFRLHLRSSIRYVMGESEVAAVFNGKPEKKLLIFTTRLRRRDGRPIQSGDLNRYFLKSLTRKLPQGIEVLAANLPGGSRRIRDAAALCLAYGVRSPFDSLELSLCD